MSSWGTTESFARAVSGTMVERVGEVSVQSRFLSGCGPTIKGGGALCYAIHVTQQLSITQVQVVLYFSRLPST